MPVILITSIVTSLDRADLHPTKGKRILIIDDDDGNDQDLSKLRKLFFIFRM